ncbi:ligase-associated DNA damage response endonuclease PdeM [Formosa sediminum]|uniref:Ligase-associated DNA damage response endonuclease PdeM n=1 Tax=Formosa sediminum TaxID=2594004 RepID=A0A516GSI7_9FLAO|nr:ligase-associated DNA damage response endonuclease PdeM [Formosa sediminum]QDO94468.1 ligase-associated DNA damage response endonuclease PdeM [Formosa sediminum]
METLEIYCNAQRFILHPLGGAFWVNQRMLLIADVHLGKVTHFRKHGSAIPRGVLHQNFKQLQNIISAFDVDTVCILGDLFHSHLNAEWVIFKTWVAALHCKVVLISGNHDIIDAKLYEDLGIKVLNSWLLDGFLLTHHPEVRDGFYNLSGHIHPGVQLRGLGRQHITLSCFYWKAHQMIFPAFGVFTGKYIIKPSAEARIYVNTETEVIEVPVLPK